MLNDGEIERDPPKSFPGASLLHENPGFSLHYDPKSEILGEPRASASFVCRWRIPRGLEYDIGSQVARVASRFNGGIYHIQSLAYTRKGGKILATLATVATFLYDPLFLLVFLIIIGVASTFLLATISLLAGYQPLPKHPIVH